MTDVPENVIEIIPGADAILVVTGMSSAPETSIGLGVSRYALSMASPMFRDAFTTAGYGAKMENGASHHNTVLSVPDDNGDAMYILTNILHFRNDRLPTRIHPDMLCKLANLAQKYQCVVAVRPATLQWFDRLYASHNPGDMWRIIEAAYLLDEATFFARFTTRWVLQQSLHFRQVPLATMLDTQKLTREWLLVVNMRMSADRDAVMLCDRHTAGAITLRNDLDGLVDSCASSFSKQWVYREYHNVSALR